MSDKAKRIEYHVVDQFDRVNVLVLNGRVTNMNLLLHNTRSKAFAIKLKSFKGLTWDEFKEQTKPVYPTWVVSQPQMKFFR